MSLAEKLLAFILFLTLCAGGGFWSGYRAATNKHAADQLKTVRDSIKRAIDQAQQIAAEDAEVLSGQEKNRIERRTVFKTLEKERIKYVETHPDIRDCRLDDDGLRQWNDANAGTLRAGVGQLESAPARLATSPERKLSGPVGKP